ncbi:transient receptor potential cation channel subfamily A member 1-like [Saimiri boliviensis]|uniref:transient receptor potential cation channel subfamily A member 1-like n=1 Tax=Saimiri boliviensis TaxID=27679 RepID=UPI003D772BBB
MKRSLKRMWRPGEKKEPQGVLYEDVPDDADDCKEPLKVDFEEGAYGLQNFKEQKILNDCDNTNAFPLQDAKEKVNFCGWRSCLNIYFTKVLLEHSSTDVNLEGENGNTAVMIACTKNNSEALQILLNKGAQPRKSNKFGCFPIHQAVLSGSKECMEIILKFGEEHGYSRQLHINCVNNEKASPLHLAVQNGDLEIVKMCLDNGAQIDLVEKAKCTAVHFVAHYGETEIVKLLISSYSGGMDLVNAADESHQTVLHRQVSYLPF